MDKKYLFGAMLAMTVAFSATTTSCSENDDPKTEKEQPSADLDYTASNAKAWGNYMKNVAILLNNDAEKLYSQWAENYHTTEVNTGVPFAELFKQHDSRSGYNNVKACAQEIVEKMAEIANEVGSAKIGDPYAKWVSGKTTEALYAVESWYSWHRARITPTISAPLPTPTMANSMVAPQTWPKTLWQRPLKEQPSTKPSASKSRTPKTPLWASRRLSVITSAALKRKKQWRLAPLCKPV